MVNYTYEDVGYAIILYDNTDGSTRLLQREDDQEAFNEELAKIDDLWATKDESFLIPVFGSYERHISDVIEKYFEQ